MNNWTYLDTEIQEIKKLLDDGYEIEVESPDGYVPVNYFIEKGLFEEYVLKTKHYTVRCNEGHLFETNQGWMSAKSLYETYDDINNVQVLSKNGYVDFTIDKTGEIIPIVDINVEHENHRYYTNGISSHNTGIGKSLVMCHFASTFIQQGLNVLYITLEMAEEKIAERIDANLMDIDVTDLNRLPKNMFETKFRKVQSKSNGRLIIKQFPTGSAHVGHFRALIQELQTKKSFTPDVVFVDYLNICASSRVKNNSANSYTIVKSIAEELRGLAIEYNVPVITATQTNRSGFQNTDVDLDNTSESFGLPATVDFMMALMSTEELEEAGQIMMKTLKNRYGDPNKYKRFVVGINRNRMRLFNIEQVEKEKDDKVLDIGPVSSYSKVGNKFNKVASFDDFKF